MTLRAPFNTTVFGPFFVAGAIYSGIAAILLLMAVLRKVMHLEEFITITQFKGLGYLLAAFTLIMGYFNLQEYAVHGYKLEGEMAFHFEQLMTGPFALLFWFYILGSIALPGLLILNPRTRTIPGITAAATLALVGMYVERYLIVVAGFRVPLMPYDPASYTPSWVELSILAGAIALFMFIISVFAKLFPVVSIWEVVEHRGPEPAPAPSVRPGAMRVAGSGVIGLLMVAGTCLGLLLGSQASAADPVATKMTIALPAEAHIGQTISAQARLQDAAGAPVANATLKFTSTMSFLGSSSRVVLADAVTDKAGTVTVEFDLRTEGSYDVRAAFGGDDRYAFSNATATIKVAGSEQLYVQSAGVRVPGLNEPPAVDDPAVQGGFAQILGGLWPRLSGWPIAIVLMIVWSLYLYVTVLVARISRAEARA
jgi:hypothetical protein